MRAISFADENLATVDIWLVGDVFESFELQ